MLRRCAKGGFASRRWLLAAAGILLSAAGTAGEPAADQPPPRRDDRIVRAAECSDTIRPDRLVVSGGLSAESVRPKDGSDQIEKQLAAMRSYVQGKGGKLIERERLRAARNPQQERDGAAKMPFIQVQRIEAEFPLTVDIDDILERLLKMGMDRYGKDTSVEGHGSRDFKVLTSYRFTALEETMRVLLTRCVREEAQKACGPARADACVQGANVFNAYAQTEPVANRDGHKRAQMLRVPGVGGTSGEPESLEPLSAAPLRVRLTLNVGFQTGMARDTK